MRGNFEYRHLSNGDRILDFSYAGYMGGGVALPTVPAQRTVRPSGDDDSVAIQTHAEAPNEIDTQSTRYSGRDGNAAR
jgi:hypothetical protein